jgi:hypothetical protein
MWYSYVSANSLERVLLEKLMVNRLVKKFTKFDGNQNVVTVFTKITCPPREQDRSR